MAVTHLRRRTTHPFEIRRRALKAHATHSHAIKWLDAVRYLRKHGLWVIENGATPSWRADPPQEGMR